jgi:VanZ family protein
LCYDHQSIPLIPLLAVASNRTSSAISSSHCCSASVGFQVLLVFVAVGPAKWVPRSGLGWRIDHFLGYFVLTLIFCLAWSRPLVIGGALMALALLLEGMHAFTPDRHADVIAALISAGGAMAAVLPAGFLIRALN